MLAHQAEDLQPPSLVGELGPGPEPGLAGVARPSARQGRGPRAAALHRCSRLTRSPAMPEASRKSPLAVAWARAVAEQLLGLGRVDTCSGRGPGRRDRGCSGGVGDGAQGGQGGLDGARRLIPARGPRSSRVLAVSQSLQAQQVGGGGQARPDDQLPGLAALLLLGLRRRRWYQNAASSVSVAARTVGAGAARMAWATPGCIR